MRTYPTARKFGPVRVLVLCAPLALSALCGQTTAAAGGDSTPPTPAAGQASSAKSSAAAEETVNLPEFNVSASRTDPYRAADVTSVARVAGSIIDSPFTVNVVSQALLNDLGANTGFDVDRYFAGVSAGRGAGIEGISDRQDFRGFESFTRTIDDFATTGFQANWDTAFVERQELVMGPDTILSPTGTPGGSVNVITKSPQFERSTWVSAEVGNINAGKYTVDTTGPLTRNLAYRAIVSYQSTPTYMPGSFRQGSEAAMLTYKPWNGAQLSVKYFHEDWGQRGEAANANDWGEIVYTPETLNATISNDPLPGFGYQSWNGSSTWSRRNDRVNLGEMEFTAPLFNLVKMRFGAQMQTDHWLQDTAYPSSSPGEAFDPNTGYATAVTLPAVFNITAMPVVGQYATIYRREFQVQNDYAANFEAGPVSIQPVAGWAYEQDHTLYSWSAQNKQAADLPPVNLLANEGTQVVGADQHPPLSHYISSPSNTPSFTVQKQAYALAKVGLFTNRLYLTGGASRVWINTVTYKSTTTVPNGANLALFVPPYSRSPLDSQRDTYLGGVLLKPTTWSSVYYSFSTNAALTSFNNLPLWQQGKQHEFGFKAEFFDQRLQISGDHFQIAQSNLSTPNPAFNIDTSQPPNLLVNATSKGFELNVVGGLTKELSVIASVTGQRYRDIFNRRVRNVPDHLANLLLNYHFNAGSLKGANVFAGVVHSGNVAGETITASTSKGVPEQPSFYVDGWTILNAGAGYGWDRYRINFNADNMLNSHFFWDPAGRISVPVYDGITVRATFTVHL